MRRPIAIGGGVSVGQPFGVDPDTYRQFNLAGHAGLDHPAPIGTPITAPEAGIITQSGTRVKDQYTGAMVAGETIVLRGYNHEHWLLHLNSRIVAEGQNVTEGQVLGYSGNTGFSTGPHLHWGVRPNTPDMNNGYRGFINPDSVLNGAPATPAPAVTPSSGQTVFLPAHVPSWAIYREGSAMRKGTSDQLGSLLPAKFGGLEYDVLGWVDNRAVAIQTSSFGRGIIWVRDTDAVIKNKLAPLPVTPAPVYRAPDAPVRSGSPKYKAIVKDIPGYMSANSAVNRINPNPNPVKAGSDYFCFTSKYGMDNVTLVSGQPGAWINPADNVPDPIPEPVVVVPVEEPKPDLNFGGWNLPVVAPEAEVVLPVPLLPTITPEAMQPEYVTNYHAFDKAVWYKANTDTFVQDMESTELISLPKGRALPIHGTFTAKFVLYGRATKKGSERWYGVPLKDLDLALNPKQKLEAVANTVLNDPVFIDSNRPAFDRISHTLHTTDLVIDRLYKVFDVFKPKVKKK